MTPRDYSDQLVDPRSLARGQGGLNLRLDTARVGVIGGLRLRRLPLSELRRFHDERWYDTRNTHGNILCQILVQILIQIFGLRYTRL
jgi:hypothetical protein